MFGKSTEKRRSIRAIEACMLFLGIVFCRPSLAFGHHTCGEAVKAHNTYVDALKQIRLLNTKASSPTTVNNPELVASTLDEISQARMRCTQSVLRYNQAYARIPKSSSLRVALPQSVDMNSCMLNYTGLLSHKRPKYIGECPADLALKEP
jgi:hypothetical protein